MSACLIALFVLAVMGIFSARYRRWAKEAFDCVSRRVTLRPCKTGFNEAVKAKVTSKLMGRHPGFARFTHSHFEAISWAFTIILFISLAYSAYGAYNYVVYGTCDPLTGNCAFNPMVNPNQALCPYDGLDTAESVPTIGGFSKIADAPVSGKPLAYFIGTTWCPHCSWERPIFLRTVNKFSGHVQPVLVELDVNPSDGDLETFGHFSPEGQIPLVVLGGKYFRVGSGESLGAEGEEKVLTALLCDLTNNPIPECGNQDVSALVSQI